MTDSEHELSFWDGQWWCTCGATWLKTDVDARNHYNAALEIRIARRDWLVRDR